MNSRLHLWCVLALSVLLSGCSVSQNLARRAGVAPALVRETKKIEYESPVLEHLVSAAVERASHQVQYDQSYYKIAYPNGDVPEDRGACTDEVIRAYRALGIDLQRLVHEDMEANFASYPHKFGLTNTDTNIDHRRVPNLMTFFARQGKQFPITDKPADYMPGDIVTWDLDGKGMTHIGIIVDVPSATEGRYMIMHNIGAGPQIQDVLFNWKITGHYRYTGPPPPSPSPAPTSKANARNRR